MSLPKISLIINTFNQPDYLSRVLRLVATQTFPPDQVLLADDGSADVTREIFARWGAAQKFPADHVWQKNQGFRRSRILNEAVARSRGEYVVFLDGDTIPHPRFLQDHARLAAAGRFVQGHRALVEEKAAVWFGKNDVMNDRWRALWSFQLSGVLNAFHWPFALRSIKTDLRGIRGCNLAVWRSDLVRVNGYNEAFTGWGREDAELAVRLMNSGIKRMNARGWAVCFHLWHPPASRAGVPTNDGLLAAAIETSSKHCDLGLNAHLPAKNV